MKKKKFDIKCVSEKMDNLINKLIILFNWINEKWCNNWFSVNYRQNSKFRRFEMSILKQWRI